MFARKATLISTVVAMFFFNVSAEVSVMVYSKDEGLAEKTISKPRIFIENTGTEPVSDFSCLYYFTAENGNVPVIEDYYTPNESVSLQYLGHGRYAVRYDFYGVTLQPGEIFPNESGNVIGIHYQNWEPLCKGNDESFNFSGDFAPNWNIPVFYSEGRVSCGYEDYNKHERHKACRKEPRQVSFKVDIDLHR